MTITLNADYDVTLNTALLGYVGETNARPVSVEGLTVDGADRYVLTIDYGDGTAYEVDITDGTWTPTADILWSAQTVSCQICAKKLSGDEYILVKKSRIFRLRIGAAIGDNAVPSPPQKQRQRLLRTQRNLPQPQEYQPIRQRRRQAVLRPQRRRLKRPQHRQTPPCRVQKSHVSRRSLHRTPQRYPQPKHQRRHSKPQLIRI